MSNKESEVEEVLFHSRQAKVSSMKTTKFIFISL